MPRHIHLIFNATYNNLGELIRDFKKFNSKTITQHIISQPQESRKEWILQMLKARVKTNSNVAV